jgi:hypothetical protein
MMADIDFERDVAAQIDHSSPHILIRLALRAASLRLPGDADNTRTMTRTACDTGT